MSQVREIAQLGADVLRKNSEQVQDIFAPEIQALISDLFASLASTNGVGIAAPQISSSWRVIIIASRPSPRYPHAPEMQPTLMINPTFEVLDACQEKDWEGCLSIPGIRARVSRYKRINVTYINAEGRQENQDLEGFVARIFQHEYDHLNGLVYLDRVENNKDIISELEFERLMNK